jgi:hypothetical protein
MTEETDDTTEESANDNEPVPTTTLSLATVPDEARSMIAKAIEQAEETAKNAGTEPDAYYQKIRERFSDPDQTGKVTIPNVLLTPDVRDAINAHIEDLEDSPETAEASARLAELE